MALNCQAAKKRFFWQGHVPLLWRFKCACKQFAYNRDQFPLQYIMHGLSRVPYINIANVCDRIIQTILILAQRPELRPRPTPSLCALIRTLCRCAAAPNTASPNSGRTKCIYAAPNTRSCMGPASLHWTTKSARDGDPDCTRVAVHQCGGLAVHVHQAAAAYRSSFTPAGGSAAAPESGPDTPDRHLGVLIITIQAHRKPHRHLRQCPHHPPDTNTDTQRHTESLSSSFFQQSNLLWSIVFEWKLF